MRDPRRYPPTEEERRRWAPTPIGGGIERRVMGGLGPIEPEPEFPSMPGGPSAPEIRTAGTTAGTFDPLEESRRAVEEAKRKTEASKQAALGYYDGISMPRAGGVGLPPGTVISPEQQQQLLTTRRGELGAYGQTLAGMYTDPYSGVQAGQRRQIGLGIAGRQANLPIDIALQVGQANIAAAQARSQIGLGAAGLQTQASIAGTQAQLGRAGAMAGIQQAYQYDPGLEYIRQLGYGAGAGAGAGEPTLGGVPPEVPSAAEPILGPGEGPRMYGGPAPRPGRPGAPPEKYPWQQRRPEAIWNEIQALGKEPFSLTGKRQWRTRRDALHAELKELLGEEDYRKYIEQLEPGEAGIRL